MNTEQRNTPHLWYDGNNIRELAHDVRRELEHHSPRLTARPYNHDRPLETEWWLVPSTAWPAFGFGKILFSPEGSCRVFVALNVEKGFESFSGVEKKKILDRIWAWHGFVDGVRSGAIQEAATTVATRSESPIQVILQLSPVNNPGYSRERLAQRDFVRWHLDGNRLVMDGTPQLGLEAVEPILDRRSFSDLMDALVSLPEAGWYWFDVAMGVWIGLGRAPDTGVQCTAFDLAERLIVPWLPWVR